MAQDRLIRQQQMQVMPEIKNILLLDPNILWHLVTHNYIHTAQSLICKMYFKLILTIHFIFLWYDGLGKDYIAGEYEMN